MRSNVTWSSYSEKDLENILEYLAHRWSNKTARDFIKILNLKISDIATDPKRFTFFEKSLNIRKCLITKHNILYYKEAGHHVHILRIYDTRQNPESLKF